MRKIHCWAGWFTIRRIGLWCARLLIELRASKQSQWELATLEYRVCVCVCLWMRRNRSQPSLQSSPFTFDQGMTAPTAIRVGWIWMRVLGRRLFWMHTHTQTSAHIIHNSFSMHRDDMALVLFEKSIQSGAYTP